MRFGRSRRWRISLEHCFLGGRQLSRISGFSETLVRPDMTRHVVQSKTTCVVSETCVLLQAQRKHKLLDLPRSASILTGTEPRQLRGVAKWEISAYGFQPKRQIRHELR